MDVTVGFDGQPMSVCVIIYNNIIDKKYIFLSIIHHHCMLNRTSDPAVSTQNTVVDLAPGMPGLRHARGQRGIKLA